MTPIKYKSVSVDLYYTNGIEYARILKNHGDEQGWGLVIGNKPIISLVTVNSQESTAIYLLQSPTVVLQYTFNVECSIAHVSVVVYSQE